jgi:hypothetical protein
MEVWQQNIQKRQFPSQPILTIMQLNKIIGEITFIKSKSKGIPVTGRGGP